jgi:hypothetical protein
MGKDAVTATTTEGAPEITSTKTFSDPLKAFKERRKSKATKDEQLLHTADRKPHKIPTAQPNEGSMSGTSALEQDRFIAMMRATRGMSQEETKAFLERTEQADKVKYEHDVSGLGNGKNMTFCLGKTLF